MAGGAGGRPPSEVAHASVLTLLRKRMLGSRASGGVVGLGLQRPLT